MSIKPKYDLAKWFDDQIESNDYLEYPPSFQLTKDAQLIIQFWGFELILYPDGTYILDDTSGG